MDFMVKIGYWLGLVGLAVFVSYWSCMGAIDLIDAPMRDVGHGAGFVFAFSFVAPFVTVISLGIYTFFEIIDW